MRGDPRRFVMYLGKEDHYQDFLAFFKAVIDGKGYDGVVREYLLKGDERANDMLVRMHMGKFLFIDDIFRRRVSFYVC